MPSKSTWYGLTNFAVADNVRPVYLDLEVNASGAIQVVWKVPLNQPFPALFEPRFPESFKVSSPISRVKTSNATIEKWTMVSSEEGLAGATIGIQGLEQTTTDALVRIHLADGSLHRIVLRPTETSTVIPASGMPVDQGNSGVRSMLGSMGVWPFVGLFVFAWLLSLMPRARKRCVLPCALALVAGSLFGHALGNLSSNANLFNSTIPSDTETKRILQGLMLNTYRAFIMEQDEEIYDVLARSVSGDFLNEVYLQNKETLRIYASDGVFSLVDRLDVKTIESMKRQKDGSIAVIANWDVYGSVRHQDHIHFRCNTYKAEVTIVPTENYWKLTSVELLDEERVI